MAGCYCGAAGSFGLATGRGVTLARAPTPRATAGNLLARSARGRDAGRESGDREFQATWGFSRGPARGRVGQTAASEPSEPCGLAGAELVGRGHDGKVAGSQAKGGGCWATARRCFLFNNGPWTRFLTQGPVEDIRRPLGPGPATGAFPASGPFYP